MSEEDQWGSPRPSVAPPNLKITGRCTASGGRRCTSQCRAGHRAAIGGRVDQVRPALAGSVLGVDPARRHQDHRPMARRLFVEAHDADDVNLFAGVEKWSGRAWAGFEGSCGYGRDRITTGWLKASLRALDRKASRPFDPVPACTYSEPLAPGQVVAADIALAPRRPCFGPGKPCDWSTLGAGSGRATRSPDNAPHPSSRRA